MNIIDIIAAVISGILGSMGLGGGGVLVLYLTLFKNKPQLEAQGTNLLFFIPCAVLSVIAYTKKKMIEYSTAIWLIIGGLAGVGLGTYLLSLIETKWISILFALFLLINGLREIFTDSK